MSALLIGWAVLTVALTALLVLVMGAQSARRALRRRMLARRAAAVRSRRQLATSSS